MMKRPFLINLAAALAALILPIVLASVAVQQSREPPVGFSAADDASIHAYGDTDKTCLEWTDGCRTCLRVANTATCPNIGIACQPKPITCVRREEPPKPAEPPKPPQAAPKQDGAPK
jgi:hypothetical protein